MYPYIHWMKNEIKNKLHVVERLYKDYINNNADYYIQS